MSDQTPKVFVFDAVGTLIKPAEDVATTYQRIGRNFGSQLTRDEISFRFQTGRKTVFDSGPSFVASDSLALQQWRQLASAVFGELAEFDQMYGKLWEHYSLPSSWRVFDDVLATLAMMEQAGVQVAIASNFDSRLMALCRRLKPLDRIPDVFCSSETGYAKPAKEFFSTISSRLKCPANRMVMVGDDFQNDIVAARRAGWQAVFADRSSRDLAACLKSAFPFLRVATGD